MPIGIIAKYNPFPLGHAAQIAALKRAYPQAQLIIAMSGAFVQRGLPAVAPKRTRTRFAKTQNRNHSARAAARFIHTRRKSCASV